MLKRLGLIALCAFLSACSASHLTPPTEGSYGMAAPNHFAELRGKAITSSQIDAYIAASVTGPDRVLAHQLMAAMPAHLRGDFIALDQNGHVFSNNPNLLQFVSVHTGHPSATPPMPSVPTKFGGLRPFDGYQSQCAPPPSNTGAFIRDVASCGMTDGWGFVNIPCNSTYMAPGDSGYAYMEIVGSGGATSGSLIEGGLQYNYHGGGYNDTIQAYVRTGYSVNGGGPNYQQMNYSNPGYSFGCGQNLTITHGISMAANDWIYTMVGQLPPSIDPQTQYINMNSEFFYPDNYVWLWTPPATDVGNPGTDFAGYTTPCAQCTVASATSIAQSHGYSSDGSYFGVSGGVGVINWMEVIFGEYASECTGQTGGTCQIESSSDPSVYYAGTQTYPNSTLASETQGSTGWGPYETYDGIDVSGQVLQSRRAFSEPLPPPPCSPDAHGYCTVHTSGHGISYCYVDIYNPRIHDTIPHRISYIPDEVYATYHANGRLAGLSTQVTEKDPYDGGSCAVQSVSWTPQEPKVEFGDPNLP